MFKKFQSRYLSKWTNAVDGIEEHAIREWSLGLSGLNGEQIRTGLNNLKSDWPPSLTEFRKLCLGDHGKNEFGLDYVPAFYRQGEQPKRLSSDARKIDREKTIEKFRMLKESLRT